MNYMYRNFVKKDKIKIYEDITKMYRYSIRLPFSFLPKNKVLVLLKNPSIATGISSDYTLNKICDYCYKKGYDEVVVCNLFSYRAKKSSCLVNAAKEYDDDYVIGIENDNYIKKAISEVNDIIIAWGEHPTNYKKQYSERIKNIMNLLQGKKLFYVGKLSKKGEYPLHAQVWSYDMPMIIY